MLSCLLSSVWVKQIHVIGRKLEKKSSFVKSDDSQLVMLSCIHCTLILHWFLIKSKISPNSAVTVTADCSIQFNVVDLAPFELTK